MQQYYYKFLDIRWSFINFGDRLQIWKKQFYGWFTIIIRYFNFRHLVLIYQRKFVEWHINKISMFCRWNMKFCRLFIIGNKIEIYFFFNFHLIFTLTSNFFRNGSKKIELKNWLKQSCTTFRFDRIHVVKEEKVYKKYAGVLSVSISCTILYLYKYFFTAF